MSIRGRIFFIVMSCLSLGLIFAFIVAERDLGASLQDQIQIELQKQGQIIKSSLGPLSQYNDLNSLKDETDALAQASQSRITLINSLGIVISDSNIDVDDLDQIDNHSNRPEVIDAQNNGMGWSRRFSDTIQQEMLYFAIADPSSAQQGVIRLAVPYNYFDQAFRSLNTSVILILVVALIGSILAGIIAGNYTRENFLELERAVSRLESGDLKKKTMTASIVLVDLATGEVVLSDSLSANATLGTVSAQFAQTRSDRHADERLAMLLADRVAARLHLFFSQTGS